jgi:LmbE family N-acetylglucosaminyl deacetylase
MINTFYIRSIMLSMRKIALSFVLLFLSQALFAQAPPSWTSAQMYQGIKKLNILGSVLYIAAHPDDENTRLITYLSKDKLYRTGYLSLTRGDGGQNLIGDEQGIELGLIRTQELLAARRIDGGEQFFTRAFDFGFSKNPEETFTKWDREKILSDVVWVIRRFQPDVIVTRFPATGEGGHGHHTASAILANEAFEAAADPNRFSEQLNYYGAKLWQPKRILWNTFNFGGTNTQREDQLKIDVGGYNPLLGKSYGEIAAESRSQHKSQGFGVPASRGEALEYFKATKGNQPAQDLMDDIDLSWSKVEEGAVVQKMVDSIATSFDFINPEKSVKGLVNLFNQLMNMRDGYWRNKKLAEVQELIEQCSGLFMDVTTTEQFAVQKDSLRINFSFNNRLGTDARLERVIASGFDSTLKKGLDKNKNINFSKTVFIDNERKITQPYWLDTKMETGYYNVNSQEKIGQPDVDVSINAAIQVRIFNVPFNFLKPVKYKFTDPVKGELYNPLVVLPTAEFDFVNENNLSLADSAINVQLHFKSNRKDSVTYPVSLNYSDSWFASRAKFTYNTFGNTENYSSSRFKPKSKGKNIKETIAAEVQQDKKMFYAGLRKTISYSHIPNITYFKEARTNIVQVDLKTYGKKIGYITGAGDKVPEALEQMGYEVTLLGNKELSKNNLNQFDAIITGVRAYNTHDWMNNYYDKLMKYVNEGGNLIVQYNTSNQIGPVRAKIGPYNFNITRNRVTDETAKVTLLKPEHPAFNFPNKITDEDFKDWIQERSIYHASDTSGKFEKLIGMNDPGDKSDDGSLIVTKYGKGWFTYTGIVFFRELPAGVPGAYRLLANLIALNKKRGF